MNLPPIEPSADKRGAAQELREFYLALTGVGFAPHEALAVVGQVLVASMTQKRE